MRKQSFTAPIFETALSKILLAMGLLAHSIGYGHARDIFSSQMTSTFQEE